MEVKIISVAGERSQEKHTAGSLFVVGLPIGNDDDITLRALRILRQVHVVAAKDTKQTQRFLRHYGIDTPLTTYDRRHAREKTTILLDRLHRGQNVALVSACGMPAIYDPGSLLIASALRAGIPVVPVPGPSALVTAVAVSGIPADTFQFQGRIPRRRQSLMHLLDRLKVGRCTSVFFIDPIALRSTLKRLKNLWGNRRIVVAIDLTKPTQQIVGGTISQVLRRHSLPRQNADVTLVIAGRSPN